MSHSCFERWHLDLQELLGLAVPPVAIAFISHVPAGIERIQRTMPPRTADGRTGAVAASCVFWIEGTQGVFATEAEDHGNCSVGSLTHGFKTMKEIAAECRRRRAVRDRMGHAGSGGKGRGGARKTDMHSLWTVARYAR